MLSFDAAETEAERLAIHGALTRHRLLILRMIGWPREGSLKAPVPRSMDALLSGHSLGDIEVDVTGEETPVRLPDPAPPTPD